jgi:hypothetical protein
MQAIAIVAMSVAAAVLYGILHDQVTARVCIEYFTIGHPQILVFPTDSPTVLGIAWGIVATWWVGAGLGIPLAGAAQFGSRRKVGSLELLRPLILLMAIAGLLATIAGFAGYYSATKGWIALVGPLAAAVPANRHSLFIADSFAHNMSYLAGAIGGIVLITRTWRFRRFPVKPTPCC